MENKIALLTGFDPIKYKGGIEKYSLQFKDCLEQNNINVEIIFPPHLQSPKDLYKFCKKIKSYIENNFNLLIYNSPYGLFSNMFNIPKIGILHGSFRMMALNTKNVISYEDYFRWFHMDGMIEFVNINNSNVLIAVSNYVKNNIKKLYRQTNNIHVINNAIPTDFFKPVKETNKLRKKLNLPTQVTIGLFVGRNDSTKGYDIFQEVYKRTKDKIFWIQALSSGGLNQYHILPIPTYREVSAEVMQELYNASNFVYLPSRYEGFGLAFVESLSCGKPAITTNVGVATDFTGVWNDFKIDPTLPKEEFIQRSVELITMLTKHSNLAVHLGNVGRSIVKQRFSLKNWESKILNLILSYTSSSANV